MTKKLDISSEQNIFLNGQQVDSSELTLEQTYNNKRFNSIINNHIGSGFIPESLEDIVLFDSSKVVGLLDGKPIYSQLQPTDLNYGNQLLISLSDSLVSANRKVKVAIVGTDLNGSLQYETFVFAKNEFQVTKKHFTKILLLLFNDVSGLSNESLNLGGLIIIKQAPSGYISRDPLSFAVDQEPSLFWRDFYTSGYSSILSLLTAALPLYNVTSLNISTTSLESKVIEKNNITTFIGQKFKATSNNIQKINVLCSVQNTDVGFETDLSWTGDLVVSLFPLQTSVSSPYDIAPNLDIEFSPINNPLAQISFNYNSLAAAGIVLSNVPQPIEFVFSNSAIANGVTIKEGSYYCLAIRRSGTADKCNFLFESSSNDNAECRYTTFNNDAWIDIPEQSLWIQVYSDTLKITDGSYYDSGVGLSIDKYLNASNVLSDYCLDKINFAGNQTYYGYLSSQLNEFNKIQDPRTGQLVNSSQQYVPNLQLINETQYLNISNSSSPFIVGTIADKNKKTLDTDPTINFTLNQYCFINNSLFLKVFDDPTSSKYDPSIVSLKTNILNGNLSSAKIYPYIGNNSLYFKIGESIVHNLKYGDLNSDNVVDSSDYIESQKYNGLNLSKAPPLNTSITTNGILTTYENGYLSYVNPFASDSSINFQMINSLGSVLATGSDGYVVPDPNDLSKCLFHSSTVNFSSFTGIDGYQIVLMNSLNTSNYGAFQIIELSTLPNILTLSKYYLNEKTYLNFLKSDIDGNFIVNGTDLNKISDFYKKVDTSTLVNRSFSVIQFVLEKYVDRLDDYYTGTRSSALHSVSDLFQSDGYFASFNFTNNTISSYIETKLNWKEEYLSCSPFVKYIPTSIDSFVTNENNILQAVTYPIKNDFVLEKSGKYLDGDLFLSGDIKTKNGDLHKLDIETANIILEIPNNIDGYERRINVFNYFVSENQSGNTLAGYPALKFADGTYVQPTALQNDQVRFSVSTQSYSPNLIGVDIDGYTGIVIDGRLGVYIDELGVLSLNFSNLYEDEIYKTLVTRVNIQVTLKKSKFRNPTTVISSLEMQNLLQL